MAWSDCVGRFVFIMGTSMTFSFRGMYRREMTVRAIITKIVTRAIKLFALGIVLGSSWGRESGVVPGLFDVTTTPTHPHPAACSHLAFQPS